MGSAGKNAILNLTFQKFGDKTHLTDAYNELPAKIVRPLYYDTFLPGLPYILISNPTGGIVQGDRYDYKIRLDEGAEVFMTDTTATKIYKMDLNYASRHTDVYLAKDTRLEYLSKEIIAFGHSRWYQRTVFHVTDSSKLLYAEMFCPGRIAMDEFWDFDIYASKLIIENSGRLDLMDSISYRKEDKAIFDVIFGNRKFLLTAYWYSPNAASAQRFIEFGDTFGGTTKMAFGRGIIVKALSNNLDELKKLQGEIWRVFRKTEVGTEVPALRIY